jgi:hypothetical protein
MTRRPWFGKPAEITFTGDFHEFASGELRPGGSLLLRYDPRRIMPAQEPYRFGDLERPVIAHLQFREGEEPLDVALGSPAGVIPCPAVTPTGQGAMLSARTGVPADADRLVIWFSSVSSTGAALYDSDYGANYRFGFSGREVQAVEAGVARRPDEASDTFEVSVDTAAAVEAVSVAYVLLADRDCIKHEVRLRPSSQAEAPADGGRWLGSIDVPHDAIVRFKVSYWIGGRRLADDNAGNWYLAPEPEPDQPPPPGDALLNAARAWR